MFARSFNRDGEPVFSSRPEAPPADPAIVETGDYIVLDVPNPSTSTSTPEIVGAALIEYTDRGATGLATRGFR